VVIQEGWATRSPAISGQINALTAPEGGPCRDALVASHPLPRFETLLVFAIATLTLVATPGPGLLYLIGRAAAEGRRAGFASMLGVEAGDVVYIGCAAVGLSALLARSALALSGLRFLGAAYLIVLGVRSWRRAGRAVDPLPVASRNAFTQGFFVQVLNPKAAVFFLAYFPQFLRSSAPLAPQIVVLGVVYVLVAVVSDSTYVVLASSLAARLGRTAQARRRQLRISALAYVALGVAAAAFGSRSIAATSAGRVCPTAA